MNSDTWIALIESVEAAKKTNMTLLTDWEVGNTMVHHTTPPVLRNNIQLLSMLVRRLTEAGHEVIK